MLGLYLFHLIHQLLSYVFKGNKTLFYSSTIKKYCYLGVQKKKGYVTHFLSIMTMEVRVLIKKVYKRKKLSSRDTSREKKALKERNRI